MSNKTNKPNGSDAEGSRRIKEVHNLIILDRSGSMESIRHEAVAGVNETLGTIRAAATRHDMAQRVSLVAFCGCSVDAMIYNRSIDAVAPLELDNYLPCCMTPLYDAIGQSCTRLKCELKGRTDVAVSVTIITDGYENSSREWSGGAVKALIESLKGDGWLFAYIGANQDTREVSYSLSIDNHLAFESTPESTCRMFDKERRSRRSWFSKISDGVASLQECNEGYFDDDEDDDLADY